ncbi:hypothetical protein O181_054354 [Austropuccinia psidii MF-1]|uniref:Uncharacterized protein n=1 Tax=Austropuccinia psidii MF-1 TaxID=1389203 RepID=A0A9Q3E4H5_9BASI|nr:hypothetical protein [Austropuccinia psidii MF-1]
MASQVYYEAKDKIIKEPNELPPETTICASIDCWTTKDQSESYLAIVIQWVNPIDNSFCRTLVSFETMIGPHSGTALAWEFWKSLAERGIIKRIYSITGDNAANHLAMVRSLQRKYEGLNMQWDQNDLFHRCACHVLNLVAKDFLLYMGELSDDNYKFFSDYLAVDKAPIEESDTDSTPTNMDNQGEYPPLVISEEVPDD